MFQTSSSSAAAAAAVVEHTGSGLLLDAVSEILYKVEHMPQTVGLVWIISSAFYTTYATNTFLTYRSQPAPPPRIIDHTNLYHPHSIDFYKNNHDRRRRSYSSVVSHSRPTWLLPTIPAHNWSVTRPTLLTLFRFGGSLFLGLILHADFRIWDRLIETLRASPSFLFPATCLFLANFSNAISLNRIGISLTYTSKCAIPLITVLLTFLTEGVQALPHGLALISLVPIALGIAAASWHAPTFETVGFLAAMISATAQSALNVSTKRAMIKTGIRGASTQRVMVALGFVIAALVTWMEHVSHFDDGDKANHQPKNGNLKQNSDKGGGGGGEPLSIYIMAVTAYHIEYVLSFMFVKLVSPVTFGACDAVRRLGIILAGRSMFGGKPLTPLNMAGIALALLGALGYSIATSAAK